MINHGDGLFPQASALQLPAAYLYRKPIHFPLSMDLSDAAKNRKRSEIIEYQRQIDQLKILKASLLRERAQQEEKEEAFDEKAERCQQKANLLFEKRERVNEKTGRLLERIESYEGLIQDCDHRMGELTDGQMNVEGQIQGLLSSIPNLRLASEYLKAQADNDVMVGDVERQLGKVCAKKRLQEAESKQKEALLKEEQLKVFIQKLFDMKKELLISKSDKAAYGLDKQDFQKDIDKDTRRLELITQGFFRNKVKAVQLEAEARKFREEEYQIELKIDEVDETAEAVDLTILRAEREITELGRELEKTGAVRGSRD